jgi:hypothetical protein
VCKGDDDDDAGAKLPQRIQIGLLFVWTHQWIGLLFVSTHQWIGSQWTA